eukprot:TRINITY_DN94678_c0_g1_i1.p1 TRINITY_DN94678_c0_g1~~TRINITY_DN94678_c0_g1_i1.p1  ORF type:complete len:705 (+),score=111.61 TRINITY_DN94678_c0_g1_i1:77-2191(+)
MKLTAILACTMLASCAAQRRLGSTPSFKSSEKAGSPPKDVSMKSRVYVPHGVGTGMGFGMGAAEQFTYDDKEKYAYVLSEQGAVNVVDFIDPSSPKTLPNLAIDLSGAKGTDIEVCSSNGWLLFATGAADTVSDGKLFAYSTVKRVDPKAPLKLKEVTVGPLPDMILPNHDCSKVAVGNEGEGKIINGALVDPEGSAMIVTGIDGTPTVHKISFSSLGTDAQLIAKGVHLPLPLKAMEYWDDNSDVADDLDFSSVRNSYNSAMNLEPEYLGWSADGKKLFVSLQENSAVVTVDVPETGSPSVSRIDAYGMKDWSSTGGSQGIDVVKDDKCELKHYDGMFSMRNPDSIQVVSVDGETYILTANEGDDKEYGDYAEKVKANDLLSTTDGSAKMKGMKSSADIAAAFLAQQKAGADKKLRLSVGSMAVDYSDASTPVINKLVLFGGRSISIFKATSSRLELTWDSGSQIEKEGCASYPWAHNGVQDEEFAGVNGSLFRSSDSKMKDTLTEMSDPDADGCSDRGDGTPGPCPLGKTVDERSPKDGPSTESIVSGVACGRLIAVTAGEKAGILYIYDISNISSPSLLFVRHLSPASKDHSPHLAYENRSLGEIDPESMVFLEEAHSPSGKAGLMIAGAWSGTLSWWEFECEPTDDASQTSTTAAVLEPASVSNFSQTSTTAAIPESSSVSHFSGMSFSVVIMSLLSAMV